MQAQPANRPRVLVVDDQETLRDLLARWLSRAGYEVRVAAEGQEALSIAREMRVDVVVTDLKMPGMDGLQLLALVKRIDPSIEVIFLTGEGTMQDAIEALREGRAFDFLQKPLRKLTELNATIDKALLRRCRRSGPASGSSASPRLAGLAPRERDILSLLAQGLDNRAIAGHMALSEKTIRNYLTRIYEKLGVTSRTQALLVCREHGLS